MVVAIEQAVRSITQAGDAGLVFPPDSYSVLTNWGIVQLAAQYRVPAVYGFGEFAQRGGLISYGVNLSAQYSEAATYIDRILKGTPPADLPVQMPTKFELVINVNTAKALDLVIPPSLLAQADEVIE